MRTIIIILVLVGSGLGADEVGDEPKPEGKGVWDFIVGNGPKFCSCTCGRPNLQTNRMLGGQYLMSHEFPWLALVNIQGITTVGGVLLNERYVVTAANQLTGLTAYDVKVTLGEYDRCYGDITTANISAESIKLHPDFDPLTRGNDIALIKLANVVVTDRWISPICLARPGSTYVDQVGMIVGWGEGPTLDGAVVSTCRPRKIGLPILEERECLLGTTAQGSFTKDKGCAGVLGSASVVCSTDAGGPVMYRSPDNTYELIGILSDVNVCRERGGVAAFTRLNAHFNWLFQMTRDSCYCGK